MNRDDMLASITSRYVAEVHAGLQPRVGDYMRRYPQYAYEIADFVTYYFALEADIPEEGYDILSDQVRPRKEQSTAKPRPLTTLLVAQGERLSPRQLAVLLGVSVDIVLLLEQLRIAPATIPDEMYKRLAVVLRQPVQTVRAYFIQDASDQELQRIKVAEDSETYRASGTGPVQVQNFRQALDASTELSIGQLAEWHDILEQEQL